MNKTIKESNRRTHITDDYITLVSYDAVVAQINKNDGTLVLGHYWDYSPTTWLHVRKFFDKYKMWLTDPYYGYVHTMLSSKNGHQYFKNLTKSPSLIYVCDIDEMTYVEDNNDELC